MRAYQIADEFGLDKLRCNQLEERPPGPKEVAVRVRAVSLNYRDLLVAAGLYSKKVPRPLIICSDAAGDVAEVGSEVKRFKAGDRVCPIFMPDWITGEVDEAKARTALGAFGQGVLAERVVFSEESLVRFPGHLSYEEAATLPCAAVTAWNALFTRGTCRPGDTVLTQGTGGVSMFAIQLALAGGARVIATTSSAEKAQRLKSMGVAHTIDYVATPDWDEAARKLIGAGVDHVVDVGGAPTLAKSIRAARMGGAIYMIGNRAEGPAEINPVPAFMKSLRLQGVFVGSREMFEAMNRAIEATALRPVVDSVYPFDEAVEALQHFKTGRHFGKVVIRI